MTFIYILLAIIAFILWKIYRQKEDERDAIYNEKLDAEHEQAREKKFKDSPHLIDKIDDSWIEVFSRQSNIDGKDYLLKAMFYLMLGESTKIDYSGGSVKYDSLWDVTKELLAISRHENGRTRKGKPKYWKSQIGCSYFRDCRREGGGRTIYRH